MEIPVKDEVEVSGAAVAPDYFDASRKRFQALAKVNVPALLLSEEGSIQHVTPGALNLLEYRKEQKIDPSFFAHVHGKNLYQVMRDVADMVCYGKSSASWLLRLKTGQGRWRWFKATVHNRLEEDEAIEIRLDDFAAW